ncbi:MAG TPA: biotin carboxylase N-terminal domain-containing protein [Bacteroidales bacterium]|nr:biotin carboxylase N-terminal domain-containing protein [Bacteroidales bacterium]
MITRPIQKVLIANRGEIALRILRTLKRLNIASIVVFHEQDRDAPFVRHADQAWPLGHGPLSETYLNIEKIISIALQSGADAIHPGYGFLAENPLFPQACSANDIIFVGPEAHTVRLMGNKIEARNLAHANGLPVTTGYSGSPEELTALAGTLPFPVLVKAAAGGGGKGMRIVYQAEALENALQTTSREAATYFGDGSVYVEQYVQEPRHIEVQVLADHYGNVVHLFERECSIQRRYQKIIEESPSASIDDQTREKMGQAAVALCKAIGYRNAGTIEFLLDKHQRFYFLEMNTRIQVEHPVTEMITGIDLVEEQLAIAQGSPLRFQQSDISRQGHAIECRIYAEDPDRGFLPSPGNIIAYHEPSGQGVRVDSAVDGPCEISGMFDPMISKLIVWAPNREEAICKAKESLKNYFVAGIKTNIPFLIGMLGEDEFVRNQISTAYTDKVSAQIMERVSKLYETADLEPVAAAVLCSMLFRQHSGGSVWDRIGFWRLLPLVQLQINGKTTTVEILSKKSDSIVFRLADKTIAIGDVVKEPAAVCFTLDGIRHRCPVHMPEEAEYIVLHSGMQHTVVRPEVLPSSVDHGADMMTQDTGGYCSPMPGKVIKVNVNEGDEVNRGTILIVIEAMKMENNIVANSHARVEKLFVKAGDMVDTKMQLIVLKDITA